MDLSEIRKKSKKLKKEEKIAKRKKPVEEELFSTLAKKEEEEIAVQEKGEEMHEVEASPDVMDFPVEAEKVPSYDEPEKTNLQGDEKQIDLDLLLFKIGSEDFAFDVSYVREIIRFKEITDIPTQNKYLLGIISLRGAMIPVVDLKSLLTLGIIDVTMKTRIIIISMDEGKRFGLVVDNVDKVIDIAVMSIEIPTTTLASVENDYVKGVARKGGKLITVLDLEKILGML